MKLKVGDVVQHIDHKHIRKLRIIRCYDNGLVDALEFESWYSKYIGMIWSMVSLSENWKLINSVEDRFKFHKDRVESRHRSNHV